MLPKFDAEMVWNRWMQASRDLTVFMAVPTIYGKHEIQGALKTVFDVECPQTPTRETSSLLRNQHVARRAPSRQRVLRTIPTHGFRFGSPSNAYKKCVESRERTRTP